MANKAMPAKVLKRLTKGYSEILLPEDGWQCNVECDRCGKEPCPHFHKGCARVIAETPDDVYRDDLILVKRATPFKTPGVRLAYLMVPVMFVMGCLLGKIMDQDLVNMLTTGAIFAFLNFILAWIMNRQSRLRQRLEYRAEALLRKAPDRL